MKDWPRIDLEHLDFEPSRTPIYDALVAEHARRNNGPTGQQTALVIVLLVIAFALCLLIVLAAFGSIQ